MIPVMKGSRPQHGKTNNPPASPLVAGHGQRDQFSIESQRKISQPHEQTKNVFKSPSVGCAVTWNKCLSYLFNVNDNTKDRRCGASALRRTVALWLGLGDRVADDFRVTCGLFRFLLFFFLSLSPLVFVVSSSWLTPSSPPPFLSSTPPNSSIPHSLHYSAIVVAGIVEKDGGSVSLSLSLVPLPVSHVIPASSARLYARFALCCVTRPRRRTVDREWELEKERKRQGRI